MLDKPKRNTGQRRPTGFTLVELMIITVIVGILASVAYPSYREYVRRSIRAEGKALISDIAARMERFYFDNNRYTDDLEDLGYPGGTAESAEGHYSASLEEGPAADDFATSYLIRITPQGTHDDPKCNQLTQDSRGKQSTNVSGNDEVCWR